MVALLALLTGVISGRAMATELPLASVRYFNPYQSPTNWDGWGSAIYQGGGASVVNVTGTAPVANLLDLLPRACLLRLNPNSEIGAR